jgi:hypothetical protein
MNFVIFLQSPGPTSYLTIFWVILIRGKVDTVLFDRSLPIHPFRFVLIPHPTVDVCSVSISWPYCLGHRKNLINSVS